MKELTSEQAIALYKTEWWKTADPKQVVLFQLNNDRLCLPMDEYRKAFKKVTGRIFFTHELLNPQKLIKEVMGEKEAPTLREIIKEMDLLINCE